jgi:hypothetical protein
MLLLRDIAHESDQESVSFLGPKGHLREMWGVFNLCIDATRRTTNVAASRLWRLEEMQVYLLGGERSRASECRDIDRVVRKDAKQATRRQLHGSSVRDSGSRMRPHTPTPEAANLFA